VRAEYDFSKGIRGPYRASLRKLRARRRQEAVDDFPPLTAAQKRQLERQVRDSRDRTRYYIRTRFLPRNKFELYYNVSDDVWAMDLAGATFFKRRRAAQAIRGLLDGHATVIRIAKPPRARR